MPPGRRVWASDRRATSRRFSPCPSTSDFDGNTNQSTIETVRTFASLLAGAGLTLDEDDDGRARDPFDQLVGRGQIMRDSLAASNIGAREQEELLDLMRKQEGVILGAK